jgi:type I restriction enzyme R subunit
MKMKKHTEIRFEEAIEEYLIENGYLKGDSNEYDSNIALFPNDAVEFISKSQPSNWKHVKEYNAEKAKEILITSITKELDNKGSLYVLRHGFRCFGRTFNLTYFKPNTSLNPDAWTDYKKNIVKIYRQVHFSNKSPNLSIDVVIAINGVPVLTMELKNPLSGQTVDNAKKQYKKDRDPRELLFQFKKRALVHFAVDTDEVYMTTKLNGDDTFFLPFNKGFELGAGNPPVKDNYKTAYLWENVLSKDSLMDIIGRFLHLEATESKVYTEKGVIKKTKESLIFPRYHQLDVVRKLLANAKKKGPGHNYLVQHSAGSGKSNSIAWLAYRLSSLHNEKDEKIFHSVVVITDRRVLDKQLQDTIYQFEHTDGVVKKIDEDTKQLVEALSSGVPIIVSTIQKFPFIAEALKNFEKDGKSLRIATKDKKFAVIVDEAHSSQSGETSIELKKILNSEGIEAIVAEQILDMEEKELSEEAKAELIREMAKRGKQPNLSFFAFTATPKFKTKHVFNEPGENGESPFHLYSMKQAIEEGFILDVLENYTTYKTFFKLIKSVEEDPKVPRRKASKALTRFLSLHPHNLRQKTEIITEHFRNYTKEKIGGRAKAMIVTASRLHAVRYKQEVDKYIKEKEYKDLKALVAFSGTVNDPDVPDLSYTEVGMNNGIKERELPDKFESYEYHVLIVAEKYQTGFDQPLLHTMYVDKRLSGVQAVQTLSRLNRTTAGKIDTFVLDFVNDRKEIYDSFKPYYEITEFTEVTDPQLLYNLEHTLLNYQIFFKKDIDAFCAVWFDTKKELRNKEHKQLNAILDPLVVSFDMKTQEEQDTIKKQIVEFRNLYNFLSQIIPYNDSELEKMYIFLRFYYRKLPRRNTGTGLDLGEDVALKYYRIQKIADGTISLKGGEKPTIYGPEDVGTGSIDEEVQLSTIIEVLNGRFGTDFTIADQLFFDQIRETAISNEELQEVAKVNKLEDFSYVFDKMLERLFVERMEGNEEIFTRLMNDEEFRALASKYLVKEVYEGIMDKNV